MRSVWLNDITWEDVADYLRSRDDILVPFGTALFSADSVSRPSSSGDLVAGQR